MRLMGWQDGPILAVWNKHVPSQLTSVGSSSVLVERTGPTPFREELMVNLGKVVGS